MASLLNLFLLSFVLGISVQFAVSTSYGPGSRCSSDSYCADGLYCQDHVCKIGDSRDCTHNTHLCAAGLNCVGTGSTKKCKVLMGAGGRCLTDPYWFCEEHLTCESKICKIPERGVCTDNPDQCASGLACVGTDSLKKCKVLRGVEETCNQDPFWVCESHLTCESGRCKIPQGGVCDGSESSCASGLQCSGSAGYKKCQPKQSMVGQPCETTGYGSCQSGLVCENHVCKIPSPGVCTANPEDCAAGLACVGTGSEKRCNTLMDVGKRCHVDPFWVCKDGLVCEGNTCKIPKLGVCTDNPDQCAAGLTCLGTGSTKRCNTFMGAGERCNVDPFWICEEGLTCENNVCKVPLLGVCTTAQEHCSSGLSCVGSGAEKRCNMLMDVGGQCEVDPFWFCKPDLVCEHKRCRIGLGGECTHNPYECAKGLFCDGSSSHKVCKKKAWIGETCGPEPYYVCHRSFVCDSSDWKCKIPKGYPCKNLYDACITGTMCSGERRKRCISPKDHYYH